MNTFIEITRENIDSLYPVYAAAFSGEPWHEEWDIPKAKQRLDCSVENPHFKGFMLKEGDRVIGAVTGEETGCDKGKEFFLLDLFIHPDFQGKGYGHILLDHMFAYLKERNFYKATLITLKGSSLESYYEKKGFEASIYHHMEKKF